MKEKWIGLWIIWLFALVSFCGITDVRSQDVFRDIDQIKKDISDLKNQVGDLRNQFLGLRQAILKSVAAQDQRTSVKPPKEEDRSPKKEEAMDERELTNSICQAVGKFFGEVDAVLAMSNSSAADERMRGAFRKLNSTLQDYSKLHRVSKLLGIYEGLAWDTYVAVELTGSVQGNEEFIKTLNAHKRKYNETCPKR
jgi:hypothetical protein